MSEDKKIINGNMELMGIDINIAQVLGEKIIDQYMAQLDSDAMERLMKYITSDLFNEKMLYTSDSDGKRVPVLVVKVREKDQWGNYRDNDIPIGEMIKNQFNSRIKDELLKKVEDIVASKDYQDKIDEIANDIVEYATTGYKEDMKNRVRERMCGNVLDAVPSYGANNDLISIINNCINMRIKGYY